ncbi:MAG: CusA/CzcA family heavy metal efflux RND transporter [Candidatus Obscuribacterales bacterium]
MKKFFEQILQKRSFVLLLVLLLVGCGIAAYQKLPLEAYPDIANMQVRVITQVPGKAAEEVERLVTIPLEKELNGIPHSMPPRSVSIFGLSVITVVFDDDSDPYVARQQVLERIAQADVPDTVHPELDPNASPVGEIYRYTVEGKNWSAMDRKEVQDWLLTRKFKSVPGIVDSTSFGGPTKIFQIELDPVRMHALNLTQAQVFDAVAEANGSTGGSYLVQNGQDYMVRGIGLLHNVSDIENVVVAATSEDGVPVYVKDVAAVSVGAAVRKGQVGKNEDDDVVEGILLMRRGENPSSAIGNLQDAWPAIAGSMPPGMKLEPLYDRTALVRKTMDTIGHNVIEGIILVVVLLMVFLFSVRGSLVCAMVIPLALLTAFILLTIFKVPANLLSLGAIDFGIIIDGAVVLLENIHRHLHTHREGLVEAIVNAASEVAKPILFSTAIIFLTFLPILSFDGVEGKLFRPLAITMNFNLLGAVLATMVAMPVFCYLAYVWRAASERESPITVRLEHGYERLLAWSMKNRLIVVGIAGGVIALSMVLLPFLGSEFLPELEEGNIWMRATVLPTSVSLDESVAKAHIIREVLRSYPEVTNVISQIGSPDDGTDPNTYNNIEFLVDLKPQDDWRPQFKTKQLLVQSMSKALNEREPGVLYNFSQYIKDNMDETIGGVKGEFGAKLYGPDLKVLTKLASQIKKSCNSVDGMVDVSHDELIGQPQVTITIDQSRAARYGINAKTILDIVETSVGGKECTRVIDGEKRFAVFMRFQKDARQDPAQLHNILVPAAGGQKVPLCQVASITTDDGATAILRESNERRMAVKANIRGRDLGSAVKEAQQMIAKDVILPPGYRLVYSGQFDRAQHALGRLALVVPATLALIFLLLYIAFDSTAVTAIIMSVVPLAAAGGIVALFLTGTHFSISAGVGFIALFGVCIQNGVILVSKIGENIKANMSLEEAVFDGALMRMRPVLVATLVAMAGLVPAATATGIGSQSQRPFAIVIVGGLLPATLLALMLIPALYLWVGAKKTARAAASETESQRDQVATVGASLTEV